MEFFLHLGCGIVEEGAHALLVKIEDFLEFSVDLLGDLVVNADWKVSAGDEVALLDAVGLDLQFADGFAVFDAFLE